MLKATLRSVAPVTPAERAGFKAGDEIASLDGRTPLSIADAQWALSRVPGSGGSIHLEIKRAGVPISLDFILESGWSRADDIAWRASTWELRRLAPGGLLLQSSDAEYRDSKDR
jgi:membrane-associated protease RseP (regulator of RpoE activity)